MRSALRLIALLFYSLWIISGCKAAIHRTSDAYKKCNQACVKAQNACVLNAQDSPSIDTCKQKLTECVKKCKTPPGP